MTEKAIFRRRRFSSANTRRRVDAPILLEKALSAGAVRDGPFYLHNHNKQSDNN
jgi:hypothetical protein